MQEDYYPRGGTRPKSNNDTIVKSENLFNTLYTKGKKKNKQKNAKKTDHNDDEVVEQDLRLTCAELLSYDKIVSGMVVLGCIRNIASYTIEVEMPGRTFAKVEINAISDGLTRSLLSHVEASNDAHLEENVLQILSKIFAIRQFLPIYIINVSEDENRCKKVIGSLNPKHINSHLRYTMFKKGMIVWGTILEKSHHVYIVDLGCKNTRVILPFKNCNGKTFVEGEPLWFIIQEVQLRDNTATVTVDTNKDDVCASISKSGHIDQLVPGTCVEFTITRVLRDGLEGRFYDEYLGYINQIYLDNPMDPLRKYEGSTIKAYVLYTHPVTKFTFLTARNPHLPQHEPALPNGFIGSAKILNNTGKGVIVRLKKSEFGLVTHKRLIKSLKLNDTSDVTELVRRKFPAGSTHSCRILDYVNMDKMYICTFERNALKEEIFTKGDLKVAQAVSGVIEEINASGIVVKIGKVSAFATNEHLSNAQYSDNIKRNYRVGNRVNARVWNIDENGVKLTLKPDFLPDGKYLTNNEMAKRNDEYKGMVIKTYKKGALISFFGGVKGWLKSSVSSKDYTDMFYPGEIIKVTITHNNGSRLFVSLDPPEALNTRKLQVGQYTSGTVELIKSDGIFIRTEFANFQGFLPTSQISINYKLSNVMLNLFNIGEKIDRLMCIEKDKRRTLSLREYTYYHDDKFFVPKRSQLKAGMLLRCSIKSYDKKQLLLTSPILFFNNTIRVYKEDILDDGTSPDDIDFVRGQAVVAKLTVINENQLIASVRLSDVFDYDFEYPVDQLRKYLSEVDKIQKKFLLKEESIARYSIGQRVRCQIKKINNVGCSVIVDDGVQGIVAAQHWPNKPLIGSIHEGVILYINFIDNYLEISLNNLTNQKINKMQGNTTGIQIGQILYAKTLLIRPEFVLCSLGQQGNKQIGFMPVALHENDFKPCYDYYRDLTGTFKFIVTSIANDKIIGLEKGLKLSLENKNKSNLKNVLKRKLSTKVESDDFESAPKKIRASSPKQDPSDDEKPDINMEETDIASSENNSEVTDVKEELSNPSRESSDDESGDQDEDQDRNDESESSSSDSEDEGMVAAVDKKEEAKENDRQEDDDDGSESDRSSDSTGENVPAVNGSEKHAGTEKRRVSFSEVIQKFPITDSDGSPRSTAKFTPPSVQNYFDSDKEEASESSSDEDDTENAKPKKKKLSRSEQAEILKQREEELRRKEIEFAEASGVPQSAEQFDRRLLAEPNSSELWTQYISFHLASTEVDKARAVVRRALQTIDIKAEQDRLNVWIASMNLENYYGTKETFTKVFDEAVRCNDDFTIYMQTIKILASTTNSSVEEYIKKARAKFKQNPKMYIEIGRIYYLQKRYEEARKLKDIALMTIKNTAETVPLIVKFAIMEFDYGEEYQAEALFETILQSAPKRVDVWSTYVDQLMKRDKIDIARRVLERAVTQQLNLKKMKMLHKKYHAFEKIFGNEETQAQQKRLLEAYMKQFENVQE